MSEEEQKHLMQSYYDLHEKYYKLKDNVIEKEYKIYKAIDILNKMKHSSLFVGGEKKTNIDELLNILQGSDKDEN